MYEFIHRSEDLTPVELDLLKEYLKNYDVINGHSHVGGRSIVIDEMLLEQVLKLPTSELQVEGDPSSDFKLGSFFKTGEAALVSGQGWKTADALTPELGEWMRFVQKRLSLKKSPTYLAQKIIFATIGTINGIAFN